MGNHNNSIAILAFLIVLFLILSIFIPIGAKEGWFDNLWEYILHGNHPEQQEEVEDENDERDESDDNGDDATTEMHITFTCGDSNIRICYKN